MKKNIARIKVDNKSLLKILCSANRDYIFSIPRLEMDKEYCETHFSFHTQNNRITFKVTNMGNDRLSFQDIKNEASGKGFYVGKDIDIYKNKVIDESNLTTNLNYLFSCKFIDIRDGFIKNNFCESKTPDNAFPRIFQLNPPDKFNSVKIDVLISKNIIENPINILKKQNTVFDEIFLIQDSLNLDSYMFTVLATYSHQGIARSKK